jgi:crotonobetainyl-CoA:carnitine CoA-transferase CaiB-like acyl-CoA transferase
MRLGDVANAQAAEFGKPLDGIRVLAVEQMQAMPFATQLFARLGADVIKIEHPERGESGRASTPYMLDPYGRKMGATFVRNNLNKRSVGIDVRTPAGRDLVARLAAGVDIFAENYKAGVMAGNGLGYDDLAADHPGLIYVSVSGFGDSNSPYGDRPAYASIVESMSGAYEYSRRGDHPPQVAPLGALGDISTALFAAVGVLSALIHRERTGLGQRIDVAMLDSVVAMTDLVTNFWSMGLRFDEFGSMMPHIIMHSFRASDGWFVIQVGREHQFERLSQTIDRPDWMTDPRLATRDGWYAHIEDVIRPGLEQWAAGLTRAQACERLSEAGIVAGPCATPAEVIDDPHIKARDMLVELDAGDGESPVVVPGNPIKMSRMADGPDGRLPWLGEHTDEVLTTELGLDADELADLRKQGVIG